MNQICSKLIKKRWRRYWPRSGVVIVVNFEILAIPKRSPIYDVHKKIPTNDPPTSIIPKNGQKLKFWDYQTRFDSKLFFYISIVFEVTHLLRPPKITNKWPPPPSTHTHTNTHIHTHTHTHTHTQTHTPTIRKIDPLFKKNGIRKHVTNLKNPQPSFVWPS